MANEQRKPIIIIIKSSEAIPHLADLSSIDRVATLHQYHLLLQQFKNLKRRFGKLIEIDIDFLADPDEIEDCVDEYRRWEAESEKAMALTAMAKEQTTTIQTTQEHQKCLQQNELSCNKCNREECLNKSQAGDSQKLTDSTLKIAQACHLACEESTSESGSQDHSNSQHTQETEEKTKEPMAKRFKTQRTQELNLEESH